MNFLTWWKGTKELSRDDADVRACITEKLKTYSPSPQDRPAIFCSRDPIPASTTPVRKPDVWSIQYESKTSHDMANKLINTLADIELTKDYL